jgi:hypothetical protein
MAARVSQPGLLMAATLDGPTVRRQQPIGALLREIAHLKQVSMVVCVPRALCGMISAAFFEGCILPLKDALPLFRS